MFSIKLINRSYRVALAVLFFVPNLFGVGYVFIKKKGIPERLIPQDCPIGQAPEATELTPTQAHLYAWYKNGSLDLGEFRKKIKPYYSIAEQIIENEQKYAHSHYMFYHAQNGSFRLLQDVLKEFYALLNIQAPYTNFEFLRAFHDAIPEAHVNQFLDDELEEIKNNCVFDCLSRIKRKLLSVNLSLFGNETYGGECTFQYFKYGTSCTDFNTDWIAEAIKKVIGLQPTKDEHALLKNLFNKMDSSGSLFQICIPREQVDRCAYSCHAYGIPYRDKLVAGCYDKSKERHTRISDILDAYLKPKFVSNFQRLDRLQARLLLSQDIMLNPNNGVKLFRFTCLENQNTYHEGVRQFVNALAARYLAKTITFLSQGNTPFNRLADMLFNRSLVLNGE